MEHNQTDHNPVVIRSEMALWLGAITTVIFMVFGDTWLSDLSSPLWYTILFCWLFGIMLWLAFAVVRHADGLAILLGEPYGTLILTVSVITIEVIMISAIMLTGENNPTLARDTLFSVLMIVLNGMVGITLIVGALRASGTGIQPQGSLCIPNRHHSSCGTGNHTPALHNISTRW